MVEDVLAQINYVICRSKEIYSNIDISGLSLHFIFLCKNRGEHEQKERARAAHGAGGVDPRRENQ
jgi:hypothetical protein